VLIDDSAMTGTQQRYTYGELLDEVTRFAGALVAQGVSKGDRAVIYLPMIPEAVVAVLACARIGAVRSEVGSRPHRRGGGSAHHSTTELRQFLTEHGCHGGLGWFLDALGFTTFNHTALDNSLGGAPL
jgi:non-ribosomal peptide synthetase component E (peptide arylation enzyme)